MKTNVAYYVENDKPFDKQNHIYKVVKGNWQCTNPMYVLDGAQWMDTYWDIPPSNYHRIPTWQARAYWPNICKD